MREVAHDRIDSRNTRAAIYRALTDVTARVHAQSQEHRRALRPLFEHLAREIMSAQHRGHEARRIGDAIVPSPSRSSPARSAPRTSSSSSRAGPGTWNIGCALRWLRALPRSFGRGNPRRLWDFYLRRRCHNRCRLAADVLGRGTALFFLGFGLLTLLRRRRLRRGRWNDVEHVQGVLRVSDVDLPRHVEESEQQRGMDCDHAHDRSAFVARVEIRSIHAVRSTPLADRCCRHETPSEMLLARR